ncbi:hypothetical protein FPOAC1_012503 [Fusarium poae]|uniref:hypothetical protein n=1 Tax=Fusarium poae TaxID=36050 RepID=UPI001CEACE52|nr:hypothetical protein FPOAC1_012503 [Fusarium poae]KAG8667670.1 hypothetical protein FPOAC1_012503 [Fusarium poae]
MSVPRPNTPEMQDLLKEFLHGNVARQYPAMRDPLTGLVKRFPTPVVVPPQQTPQIPDSPRPSDNAIKRKRNGNETKLPDKSKDVRPARYLKEPAEQVPRIQTRRFYRRVQKALSAALSTTSTTRSIFMQTAEGETAHIIPQSKASGSLKTTADPLARNPDMATVQQYGLTITYL